MCTRQHKRLQMSSLTGGGLLFSVICASLVEQLLSLICHDWCLVVLKGASQVLLYQQRQKLVSIGPVGTKKGNMKHMMCAFWKGFRGHAPPGKFWISVLLIGLQRKCLGETDYDGHTAACTLCQAF